MAVGHWQADHEELGVHPGENRGFVVLLLNHHRSFRKSLNGDTSFLFVSIPPIPMMISLLCSLPPEALCVLSPPNLHLDTWLKSLW